MRLIEVGTKLQSQNKKDKAKEVFDLAYDLFNIFWGIKLNIINLENLKEEKSEVIEEPKEGFSLKKINRKID